MDSIIIKMLNSIGGSGFDLESLTKSPQADHSIMYEAMTTFQNTAVKPVTVLVLSIILMLMLQQATTRADGNHELTVRLVSVVMIKAALIVAVVKIAPAILQMIDGLGTTIAKSASDMEINGVSPTNGLGTRFSSEIKDAGWGAQAGMLILCFIPWLLSLVANVLPKIMIFWRWIQLGLMTAFASLPLAFLGHNDTKSIGIGFLKRYATVVLQGAVLIAAVKLYQGILVGAFAEIVDAKSLDGLLANSGVLLVGPILLIILVFGSSSVAKNILGE